MYPIKMSLSALDIIFLQRERSHCQGKVLNFELCLLLKILKLKRKRKIDVDDYEPYSSDAFEWPYSA